MGGTLVRLKRGISSKSSTIHPLSPIEELPRDVMWKIMELAPERVPNLKASSRALKSCVGEYSLLRKNTPSAVNLSFFCEVKIVKRGNFATPIDVMTIELTMPKQTAKLFEMRLIRQPPFDVVARMEKVKNREDPHYISYVFDYDIDYELEYIGSCLGKQLEMVKISERDNVIVYDAIRKFVKGKLFRNVQFEFQTLTDDAINHFLRHLKDVEVDHLTLSGGTIATSNPAEILLSLSACVQSIKIDQHANSKFHNRNLLGIDDRDWAPLIVAMLLRKLDTLSLSHNWTYRKYFKQIDVDFLKERLPNLGKEIWFEATIQSDVKSLNLILNNHLVTANEIEMGTTKSKVANSITEQSISGFNLEALPREIILEIIKYAPESVFTIRATSSTLRACVDEYAMLRPLQYIAPTLRFTCSSEIKLDEDRNSVDVMEIEISILESAKHIFELRLLRHSPFDLISRIQRDKYGKSSHRYTYFLDFNTHDDENMMEFLGECMGREVGTVVIEEWNNRIIYSAISTLLIGKSFRQLNLSFGTLTEEAIGYLLKPIKYSGMEYVILTGGNIVSSNPVGFLIELSSLVLSIRITQQYVPGIDHTSPYLFGIIAAEWAPIILEMLSNQLKGLIITNRNYPRYLSIADFNSLKEKLPTVGKKIWFATSCEVGEVHKKLTTNGHSIEVDRHFLRVKPSSKFES